MANILKGAEVVQALNAGIESEVEALKSKGVEPTLVIVRVGERGDDISYEKGATKRAENLGVAVRSIVLPESIDTAGLVETIRPSMPTTVFMAF